MELLEQLAEERPRDEEVSSNPRSCRASVKAESTSSKAVKEENAFSNSNKAKSEEKEKTVEIDLDQQTKVSAITAAEDKDYDSDASGGSEAPGITQEEEFWLSAVPKKTARQKVWEATGRKRKRGGQNVDYYNRWAYAPPEKRKHQPK